MFEIRLRAVFRMLFLTGWMAGSAAAQTTKSTLWFPNQPIPHRYQTTDQEWTNRFAKLDQAASLTDRQILQAKLLSRYATQEALLDGKLAFHHPVQSYLNGIKNHLLLNKPELRDSIHIHLEMNAEPGAFMSISGDLRFTTGMFSRCISEAQVAGIIAHEIIHYSERHSEKSIRNPFGSNDSDNVRMASFSTRYSHNRELEADTKALNSFLKESGYRLSDVVPLFDLLAYSYLPLSEIPFPFEALVPSCMENYAAAFIESPRPITPKEKLDDSRSTHPNAYRRQTSFAKKLDEIGYQKGTGEGYIVGTAEQFRELQAQVKNQESFFNEIQHNYLHVLYEEMIQHPNQPTLLGMHALWSLTTLRLDNNFDKEIGLHSDFEGEISTLHWFLTNLPKKDLVLLAFRRAVETQKAFPTSEMAQRIVANLAGQSKRQWSLQQLPWEHPALCGTTDTAEFAALYRQGIKTSTDEKYFASTSRVVEGKKAKDRSVKLHSSTLLPVSVFFNGISGPLMKDMANARERLESDLLVDLEDQPLGAYLPFEATRIQAEPSLRNQVLAMDWWVDDMAYMTNWNSTISLFTDEAQQWISLLKTQRISRITYGSPLYTGFLVTFDTDTQRAVDAVRWQFASSKAGAAQMAKVWLQTLGEPAE